MNVYKLSILVLLLFSFGAYSNTDEKMRDMLTSAYGESDIYEAFFYDLHTAIVGANVDKIAKLNSYPIRVNFASGTEYFNSEKEFKANYSKIVTAEMLSRVKSQKFSELFVNSYGMHIGYGDIWFSGICVGKISSKECDEVIISVNAYNVNHVPSK
jgi:hypothetical protein